MSGPDKVVVTQSARQAVADAVATEKQIPLRSEILRGLHDEKVAVQVIARFEADTRQSAQAEAVEIVREAREAFCDTSYFEMWCVRPVGERTFGAGFHVINEASATELKAHLEALQAENARLQGNSCVLCAGKCRGHSLDDSTAWEPEEGSRAWMAARIADLEQQLAGAREAALEEAAGVAENTEMYFPDSNSMGGFSTRCTAAATAIRNLKGPAHD